MLSATKRKIVELAHFESSSTILLGISAVLAFIIANSSFNSIYTELLNFKVFNFSIHLWINDALMAIFFFVIGLEIKREIVIGELSTLQKAALPIIAALGGMIFPALIYLFFNQGKPSVNGWGIPMATDIAFAVGILTLFSKRVPIALKILLLALAIVDDLGAILVIAFFYTSEIRALGLIIALASVLFILLMRFFGISKYRYYFILGCGVWGGLLYSGVHATLAGVIIGLLTPLTFKSKDNSVIEPVKDLIHKLHPYVAFGIMPIFAFANAGVSLIGANFFDVIQTSVFSGIFFGLTIGKSIGVFLSCYIACKLKLVSLPTGVTWIQVLAVAFLAGIGFTMSLFISSLALENQFQMYAKTAIFLGSIFSGLIGIFILYRATQQNKL